MGRISPGEPKPDWEAINRDYRAGLLSVREVAKVHGVSHTAIQKRVKKYPNQWKRDLTKQVQAAVSRKLVADEVATASDDEIVEEAAEKSLQIIRAHRKSIARLAEAESALLAELQDNPTRLYLAQYQGRVIQKVVAIAATERATALHALASTQEKRIRLERQAFGLKDDVRADDEPITGIFIEAVSAGGQHG
jgi:hypothetical protein